MFIPFPVAKSQSQWVNPIFPVHNKANPSSHFTPSRPCYSNTFFDPKIEFTRNSYKEILVFIRFILLLGKNTYKRPYIPKQRERPWKNGNKWVLWAKQQLCMSVTPVFVYLFCFVLFLLFLRPCSTTMWICQILTSLDVNFPTLTWPDKLKWSRKCFKAHEAIFSVNLSWRHRCEVVMSERGIQTGFHRFAKIGQIF